MTRSQLYTSICDLFGIEVPIVSAGMGGIVAPAGPELAAAVSNAGGLGVLGAAFVAPDDLTAWIERTRALTDRPFGVDTILPSETFGGGGEGAERTWTVPETHVQFVEDFRERHDLPESEVELPMLTPDFHRRQVEVILDLGVPVYVSGLGDPGFMVERAHECGITVGSVVGTSRQARRVLESGVDFVVAQGRDGGGHTGRIGSMALIPRVVDVSGDMPVLGAGAITDGRGLVAAFALGAQGAWCGSAFLATHESAITAAQKEAVVEGQEDSTTVTRSISGKPLRTIKNKWTEEFEASGLDPLPAPLQGLLSVQIMDAAAKAGRADINPGPAGQGIGLIEGVRSAADVVDDMVQEAVRVLRDDLPQRVIWDRTEGERMSG